MYKSYGKRSLCPIACNRKKLSRQRADEQPMNLEEKRRVLRRLAREQGGFFTAGQAEDVGFPSSRHPDLVRSGQWERLRRGIFRLASESEGQFSDLHVLSLFFRHRDGSPSGVFGLETAAS